MPSFNLVDNPWIPCLLTDGSRQDLSLRQALCQAHEVREIYDPSPLVTLGLHRLLLAILHRVFGPKNLNQWIALWNRGEWDGDEIDGYLSTRAHRFDLFDQERPFYQVPAMEDAGERPIAGILLEASSGNNATLFDHGQVEGTDAIPPGRAACYLVAYQAHAIGLGKSRPFYLKDAPLTRGLTVLAYGENLFETLALNLMGEARWSGFPLEKSDRPFWERDELGKPNPQGTWPSGRADYLTWASRRVHLIPEGNPPKVARCQIQQNYCLPSNVLRWDPFKRYKRDEKGWSPEGLAADKAAWRDCHALLSMRSGDSARPELLDWLGEIELLRQEGRIQGKPQYTLAVFGLSTAAGKPASVELWRHERLPLPTAYLNDEGLLDQLRNALELAGAVGSALRRAVWILAKALVPGFGASRLSEHLALDNLFWPRLEEPFRHLMTDLPRQGEGDLQVWQGQLRRAALESFRGIWRELETSDRGLKALVQAEGFLYRELAKVMEPPKEEDRHESAD